MTEEEIKNLKVGDKFTVEYTAKGIYDSKVQITFTNGQSDGTWPFDSELLQNATLVKPAPTFEVGDTVRIVPDHLTGGVYGHDAFHNSTCHLYGTIVRQGPLGDFEVAIDNTSIFINVHCLTLVKKAEKEKYRVAKYGDEFQIIWADFHVAARFDKIIHPNAKAAAEAECARLNAEWRAQQLTNNN